MNLRLTIKQFQESIDDRSFTIEEFISETLDRIKQIDVKLHSFISISDTAISQAQELDKKLKNKEKIGSCHGLPFSIKDNICTKGMKTTCASKMLENFVSPYDATVVSNLKNQDAIIIGKTNLDEFGMGVSTGHSYFGPSKNPWNIEYVPGGSSGGSAVALSSLECMASLGSDTGGSVRNPASFCSIVGLKPSYGLVSRYGLVSYSNSIEQIGPMARTVEDTAFILNIISGKDFNDNTTHDKKPIDYTQNLNDGIEGKKIGIIDEMIGEGVEGPVKAATSKAISKLEGLGAKCHHISLDLIKYSVAAYYTIASTEAGSNLARFDNIRYGFDFDSEGFEFNSYISKVRKNFGPEVKRRLILGAFVPSAGYGGRYFLKALKVKSRIKAEINDAFKKFDFLISPTSPVLPFKIGEKLDDPLSLYLLDINTIVANLSGIPAISVPFEISNGLPIGIQLFASTFEEKPLLQAAYSLEKTTRLPGAPI